MLDKNITLTIIELFISLIVEGVILTMVFQWISSKSTEKQQQTLKDEMNNIEKQNKFDFEVITQSIKDARDDIISQIKESKSLK